MSHRVLRWTLAGALSLAASLLLVTADAQDTAAGGRAHLGIGGENSANGVAVRVLETGGPADKAGIKVGDVITKVDGQPVKSFDTLADAVTRHKPGDKLTLGVSRDDKERDVTVTLGAQPAAAQAFPKGFGPARAGAFLGVQTQPLTPELRQKLGVKAEKGALVTDVVANSPAAKAGLQETDVITAVDGQAVTGPDDLREAVRKAGAGREVAVKVDRGKESKELRARLEQTPAGGLGGLPPNFERPGFPAGNPADLLETPNKVRALEQKVQDLERRVRELEQKLGQSKK